MENVKVVLQKQWYKKGGEVKCGYTPILLTLGKSIMLRTILHRDFYALQELANKGLIEVVEINTKDNPKDLDLKK